MVARLSAPARSRLLSLYAWRTSSSSVFADLIALLSTSSCRCCCAFSVSRPYCAGRDEHAGDAESAGNSTIALRPPVRLDRSSLGRDAVVDQLFDRVEFAAVAIRPCRCPRQALPPALRASGSFRVALFAAGFTVQQATPACDSAGRRICSSREPAGGGRPVLVTARVSPAIFFHRRSSASCPMSIRSSVASVGETEGEGSRNEQVGARNRSRAARKSDSLTPVSAKSCVEPQRAANGSAFAVEFRERAESLFDRQFLSGALGAEFVGVARQRLRHAPDVRHRSAG